MAKSKPAAHRDPGCTLRVPLADVEKLREIVDREGLASPVVTRKEAVARLAQRALRLGLESHRLLAE